MSHGRAFRAYRRIDGPRLASLRVALPDHGTLDRVAHVLENEGAICLRCPLNAITESSDQAGVARWIHRLLAGGFDDVIFLSAEGGQQLLAASGRLQVEGKVQQALAGLRRIARGPRTACFLQMLSLGPQLWSPAPTSRGLIECLRRENLSGRKVGVLLAGVDPGHELLSFLAGSGAVSFPVAPYGNAPGSDDPQLLDFIDEAIRGELDAFVFTSPAQVGRLAALAQAGDRAVALRAALEARLVVGVGKGTVAELVSFGLREAIEVERRFFLRKLPAVLAAAGQSPSLAGVERSGDRMMANCNPR